jgi:hypothetical protein
MSTTLQVVCQTLMKLLGAWLCTKGNISQEDWQPVAGAIMVVVGFLWHLFHSQILAEGPDQRTSTTFTRLPLVLFACLGMTLFGAGCVHMGGSVRTYSPTGKLLTLTRFHGTGLADQTLQVQKLHAGPGTNQGVFIGGLSESGNTTNLGPTLTALGGILSQLGAATAAGAVQGLK